MRGWVAHVLGTCRLSWIGNALRAHLGKAVERGRYSAIVRVRGKRIDKPSPLLSAISLLFLPFFFVIIITFLLLTLVSCLTYLFRLLYHFNIPTLPFFFSVCTGY